VVFIFLLVIVIGVRHYTRQSLPSAWYLLFVLSSENAAPDEHLCAEPGH